VTDLNLGIVQADCAANALYARDLGAFVRAGLDVRMQPMPGERDRVHTGGGLTEVLAQAVAGGGLDIGIANVVILGLARAAGVKLRYIAPAAVVLPAARQIDEIMVLRDSPLEAGPRMNGATFAVNRVGNLQQVLAKEWVALHGGDPASLTFTEVAFERMGDALTSGEVDAIMPTEPWGTLYAPIGKFIGNAFEGIGPRFMLLGWFAADAWLAEHTETAVRFAGAMREASAWANEHRAESARMLAAQPHTRVDVELASRMVRATYGLDLDPAMIAPPLELAVKTGAIAPGAVAPDDLIW
jgi:ABC-type nitrate/sulfonate/bicarbonate transport system substrate-binding protein